MGRKVSVIVKVEGHQIVTTDGVHVTVQLQAGERLENGSFAHIEGKVTRVQPLHIESIRTEVIPVGHESLPNFDADNYNKAVDLMTGKYSYLFA